SRQYNNYRYLYNQNNLRHEEHVQYAGEKNFHVHKTYSYFDNGKTKRINYLTQTGDVYRSESFEYVHDTFLSSKINNKYEKDSIVEFQITTYEYDSLYRLCREHRYDKLKREDVNIEIVCYFYHRNSGIRKRTLSSFFS